MTSKTFKEIFPLDTSDDTVSDLSDLKDDSWISTDNEAGRLVRRTYTYPYDATQTRAKRRHVRFWDEVEPEEQPRKDTPIAFVELEKPELLPDLLAKKEAFLGTQELEALGDTASEVDISIDLPSSVIDSDDDPLGMNDQTSPSQGDSSFSQPSQGLSTTSQPLFSQPTASQGTQSLQTSTPHREILASQVNTRKLKFSSCESSPGTEPQSQSQDSFRASVLKEITSIKNQLLKLQESILTHPFPKE
ncbi:Oidioi.mRNA.OKI2018_I69.chr1.g2617.t1.cds [Oikopleura dioica]|uniref:Oidioi.mRNA.OKI2018_I69.chr1.g2617.t1.cds n=1 Tax=Oikopleura dioica TaxID=34765 RepID=A0ABN7SWW7_OIKDI|nr:Oidioi.mRNA.OKI2018_I69.chr1.g2617.t1.cds [Oikopleura dioica]